MSALLTWANTSLPTFMGVLGLARRVPAPAVPAPAPTPTYLADLAGDVDGQVFARVTVSRAAAAFARTLMPVQLALPAALSLSAQGEVEIPVCLHLSPREARLLAVHLVGAASAVEAVRA